MMPIPEMEVPLEPGIPANLVECENKQAVFDNIRAERWHGIIEQWAYRKWQEAGCPDGRSEEFWIMAEQDMRNARHCALLTLKALYWQYKYDELLRLVDAARLNLEKVS